MTPAEAVEIIKREAAQGKLDPRVVTALGQVLPGGNDAGGPTRR
jgi:HD-GYP domain-containing protein (c-di-GMP phosphodiesterase class II)